MHRCPAYDDAFITETLLAKSKCIKYQISNQSNETNWLESTQFYWLVEVNDFPARNLSFLSGPCSCLTCNSILTGALGYAHVHSSVLPAACKLKLLQTAKDKAVKK